MPINPDSLAQAAERLRTARRLVVFTGAGVSAESGIPAFRDDDGFWQRFPPEQYARWDGLLKTAVVRPGQLAGFLLAVLEPVAVAQPNAAHQAIGERPPTQPVQWNGLGMSVDEADLVIRRLEELKTKAQQSMNNTHLGGDITKVATQGAGALAVATGVAMMLFPPTFLAGPITLVAGAGTHAVGKGVGEGIKAIGTNHAVQKIEQLDAYINSLKNAIIDVARTLTRRTDG